jgi:hypothetical protein
MRSIASPAQTTSNNLDATDVFPWCLGNELTVILLRRTQLTDFVCLMERMRLHSYDQQLLPF